MGARTRSAEGRRSSAPAKQHSGRVALGDSLVEYHKGYTQTEHRACAACGEPITDKYLLQVSGRAWHATCLRCCVCQLALDRQPSCFMRDDSVYCKADYAKSFGAKCAKCCRGIAASDWVRKARDHVYHLACFACDACKRQLSTGEEFALHDERVLCKTHYLEILDGGSTSSDELRSP
ncbi:LIM/homeobox protein Awh [Gryllus bimaculatus]|nr:LIM/homeobox protein Awh [Gryllus bimaculatus]